MFLHNLTFLRELSEKNESIVIIGKGKHADKYKFNPEKIIILTINDSIYNYKDFSHCTCIVEGHLNKNIPLVMDRIENVIVIKRGFVKENDLVVGCTPSIVISYIIKYTKFKNILLQGFSMDGEIVLNDPTIENKIENIYKDSIDIYSKENNIKEAYNYFKYNTSEFIGTINHYPYEWSRQLHAFEECFKIAETHEKNLKFITECSRKSNFFKFDFNSPLYIKKPILGFPG